MTHRPGRSTVVRYRAELARPGGGVGVESVVVAAGSALPTGPGVVPVDAGGVGAVAWRWPHDPALPGLAWAVDRRRVRLLLRDLGLGAGDVSVRVRAYRPGRRAVVEITGAGARLYLKVVRPAGVAALHRRHRVLAACVPAPASLGWTADGVVVLPALPGSTLRSSLRADGAAPPGPEAIAGVLDELPAVLAGDRRRPGLVAGAARHGRVLASVLPAARGRVDDLAGALAARPLDERPSVPVHGDLHDAQLLVGDGRITGLVDVDTAGAGERADDLANLCAHLSIQAASPRRAGPVGRYAGAVLAHAEATVDPADLRPRIAAAVLGLAAGPFRSLDPDWPARTLRRLDLAARWLDAGNQVTAVSEPGRVYPC